MAFFSLVPELTRINRLLSDKSGRDKLYKTLQYLLKWLIELAHLGNFEHAWLPHLKRFSTRVSQARSLFRLGSFLADFERLEKLLREEEISWSFFESVITNITVLVSNWFDSAACIYGIIKRDINFTSYYSTLFWLLGIMADIIRQVRTLFFAIRAEMKWRREHLVLKNSPEGQQTLTPDSKADYQKIRESRDENTVALAKSACDAVTALAILYPVTVGRYRLFVCSCGLFAGSVGLVQSWNKFAPKLLTPAAK